MTKFNVGNVGDKVRILDGQALLGNSTNRVTTGNEYEIISFHEKDEISTEHIKVASDHSGTFTICDWEYKYIELVKSKPTKNQRITALENEVAELKLIVHELRDRPQLTTIVNNIHEPSTTNTVEDIIEFEGKQYSKVNREARGGDVVIFRNNNTRFFTNGEPYKVAVNGCPVDNEKEAVLPLYHDGFGRTPETVDVYELIETKPLTPNQQRAAIIEKAKKFVDENKSKYRSEWNIVGQTVQILIYDSNGMLMMFRQAKCNPSDVFNEHIGKAIALGRALNLDVSEFEQVVQPTEKVLGMIVEWRGEAREISRQYIPYKTCNPGSDRSVYGTIINDTNAIYWEGQ